MIYSVIQIDIDWYSVLYELILTDIQCYTNWYWLIYSFIWMHIDWLTVLYEWILTDFILCGLKMTFVDSTLVCKMQMISLLFLQVGLSILPHFN